MEYVVIVTDKPVKQVLRELTALAAPARAKMTTNGHQEIHAPEWLATKYMESQKVEAPKPKRAPRKRAASKKEGDEQE